MIFLSDEHIDVPAIHALKQRGIDIVSVQELGMQGESDENLLSYTKNNRRVLVTGDDDFLRLHAKGMEHSGIAFVTTRLDTSGIIREIEKVSVLFETEDLKNSVIFIPLK